MVTRCSEKIPYPASRPTRSSTADELSVKTRVIPCSASVAVLDFLRSLEFA